MGTAALTLGGFGGISQLIFNLAPAKRASAQSTGSWSAGQNCTTSPIHAALLHTGKIFYLAGSGNNTVRQFGPYDARVLDINTGSEKKLEQQEDLFCIGQTSLADGNLLLAGGTLLYSGNPDNCNGKFHGLNSAYEFDVSSESLVKVSSMVHGRWYPTLVTLPDGKIWTCAGNDEYGSTNRLIELYDPRSRSWTIKPDPYSTLNYTVGSGYESTCPGLHPSYTNVAPGVSFYPRAHVMPSGLIVICGMNRGIWSWNPADGKFVSLANSSVNYRLYGTSFLLPLQNIPSEKGKILIVGGAPNSTDYAFTSVEMLDFNASSTSAPVVRNVAPIAYRRKWLAPVILPNGKLLILGGGASTTSDLVYIPEIFDPLTETWISGLPPASVPRVYHCVALLLLDGRVWNAGGTPNQVVWELRTEIFSPDYLFAGTRPIISGTPNVGNYGGTIDIPTPDAPNIESVSLVRLMNTTHHYDANQRLVWLQIINRGSGGITVSAPINSNIAPPGYYMVHVLNSSGVPSIAQIVKIPGTVAPPPDITPPSQVAGLTVTTASSTQLNLSWTANPAADGVANYNVYRDTTAGFTVTPGTTTPVATPTTTSYSNTGLTASTTYYYKVAAVDTAGNIGPLSSEASAATLAGSDITPPSVKITNPLANSTVPAGIVSIQGTASDNVGGSGIRIVQVRADISSFSAATPRAPGDWSSWSGSVTITTAGSHKIDARATDNTGNQKWFTIYVTIG
jgi:hypothetical protein